MAYDDTHYARLGLSRDATPEEIRSAYFEAVRHLHPDTNPDPSAVELFLKVQEAYDNLADPVKRSVYDSSLPVQEVNAPAISFSILYSRMGLTRVEEPQLVYALMDLTSIPDPGVSTNPPLNLCLVIDRSTSMAGARMDMVKASVANLIKQLRPQDIVSVVTYSDRAEVLVPPSHIADVNKLLSRVSLIQTSGGTEIYYGLEAGLHQLRQNQTPSTVSHLILLTDGQTYGDEQDCLLLTEQAATSGISISGLGIGNEWNDAFLDNLAACSGGSSMFISSPNDLEKYFEEKCRRLAKTYAESVAIDFEKDPFVELRYAFRLQPEVGPLDIACPIRIGSIAQFNSVKVLLEFLVHKFPKETKEVTLAKGVIRMEIPTWMVPTSRLRFHLKLPIKQDINGDIPPKNIVSCLARLTLYRVQEKARQEVATGNVADATRHLHHLATNLLSQGERDLAHTILMEAETIQKNKQFSVEGEKRIKYGTRALLLPTGPENIT